MTSKLLGNFLNRKSQRLQLRSLNTLKVFFGDSCPMGFTKAYFAVIAEEDWLQDNFYQLETHYRSVGVRDALVDEFMQFGMGVPVSKGKFF